MVFKASASGRIARAGQLLPGDATALPGGDLSGRAPA
jgi:hypothetical protein